MRLSSASKRVVTAVIGIVAAPFSALGASLERMADTLEDRAESERKSWEAAGKSAGALAMRASGKGGQRAWTGEDAMLAAARKVEKVADHLSAAMDHLSLQFELASRSVESQRLSVVVAAASMEEMHAAAHEITHKAAVASAGAGGVRQQAAAGADHVLQSVVALERLRNNAESAAGEAAGLAGLTELAGQAEAVGAIVLVMDKIAADADAVARQIGGIATAAEEQTSSMDDLARTLDNINAMAGENAAAMARSSQTVAEVAGQALDLRSLVRRLRGGA